MAGTRLAFGLRLCLSITPPSWPLREVYDMMPYPGGWWALAVLVVPQIYTIRGDTRGSPWSIEKTRRKHPPERVPRVAAGLQPLGTRGKAEGGPWALHWPRRSLRSRRPGTASIDRLIDLRTEESPSKYPRVAAGLQPLGTRGESPRRAWASVAASAGSPPPPAGRPFPCGHPL